MKAFQHSTDNIELVMALVISVTLIIAILFSVLSVKSKDSFGNLLPNKVIKKATPFWWTVLIYYISQGVATEYDNLTFIGFAFIFVIPPMYFYARVLVYHVEMNRYFKLEKFLCRTSVALGLSFFIWFFKIDYLSNLPLYDSFFTSYTLPIAIAASSPFFEVIMILKKFGSYRFKKTPFVLFSLILFCIASILYFPLARPNPVHTSFGYVSAFFLFCCILISIVDAFFHEMRGDVDKQLSFSALKLLTVSHDQGKMLKNALFLIEKYIKENEKTSSLSEKNYLAQAVEVLKNISNNYSKIEGDTRSTIEGLCSTKEKVTISAIEKEIYQEYSARAESKGISLVVTKDEFLPDSISFIVNKGYLLSSVVNNLIDNSIKFSRAGQQVAVDISVNEHNHLVISITDHCGGISENVIKNASNFLHNNSQVGTREEKGLGRGLVSVFYHANLLGASLEFDKTSDGCRARIELVNTPMLNPSPYDQFQLDDSPVLPV